MLSIFRIFENYSRFLIKWTKMSKNYPIKCQFSMNFTIFNILQHHWFWLHVMKLKKLNQICNKVTITIVHKTTLTCFLFQWKANTEWPIEHCNLQSALGSGECKWIESATICISLCYVNTNWTWLLSNIFRVTALHWLIAFEIYST